MIGGSRDPPVLKGVPLDGIVVFKGTEDGPAGREANAAAMDSETACDVILEPVDY